MRARSGGAASAFGSWLERRANDDIISAIEEIADLGLPPEKEAEVSTLLAKAAMLAPGNVRVAKARRAIEGKLLTRPDLKDTAWAAAKNLIDKTRRRATDVDVDKA